jgi:nucleoside-diphosphate-sugar epimerase
MVNVTRCSLAAKSILITGANGFIGRHLTKRLISEGAVVHAVSRCVQTSVQERLCWYQAEVSDIDTVRRLVLKTKPDTIFHLAGHVCGRPDLNQVLLTFEANLKSTVNMLTAAAENGSPRVVLAASLAEPVYGQGEQFPSSPFAASKWAGTAYGQMFHALYNLPVVIARIFMAYGPGQRDYEKLIPHVITCLLQQKGQQSQVARDWSTGFMWMMLLKRLLQSLLALVLRVQLSTSVRANLFR